MTVESWEGMSRDAQAAWTLIANKTELANLLVEYMVQEIDCMDGMSDISALKHELAEIKEDGCVGIRQMDIPDLRRAVTGYMYGEDDNIPPVPESGSPERGGRRFWTCEDVAAHIGRMNWLTKAAIWWCAYRDAELLMEETVKGMARAIQGGWAPYDTTNVDDRLQSWANEAGDTGDLSGIDDAIEADLRAFFDTEMLGDKEDDNG